MEVGRRATVLAAVVSAIAAAAPDAAEAARGCPEPPPAVILPPDVVIPGCDTIPAEPEPAPAAAAPALRSAGPLTVVYDLAPIARHLFAGTSREPGLGSTTRTVRQFPLGEPFPPERWLGKVHRSEIAGRSPSRIAALLQAGMSRHRLGEIASGFVAIDEVGTDFEDARTGPELLAAMRILAGRRDPATREPLSRRVLMYAAPKMVSNVGSGHDRELWDSALAAGRLSGGLYLQMYHADGGRVTGPFTASEWRDYLPVWRASMGADRRRLRVILSNGRGVGQDEQWRRARGTAAGRATLRNGVGAYGLETTREATAWLRNWNRYARPPGRPAPTP